MKQLSRRWGLSFALLSLLAGQDGCRAAVNRTLHGEQGGITVKDGALKSTDGKVYFSVREWPAPSQLRRQYIASSQPPSPSCSATFPEEEKGSTIL